MPDSAAPALSPQTLLFLKDLLSKQQLPVGDPAWRQTAAMVIRAQDELDQELARLSVPSEAQDASQAPSPTGSPQTP